MKTKLMQFYKCYLPLCLAILFLNCSVEDAVSNLDILDGDDFTAKVNGENFRADKEAVTVKISVIQAEYYSIALVAGDILNTTNAKAIGLAMVGPNFDQLSAGKTFDKVSENDTEGGGAGYSEELGSNNDDIETDFIESVFIKITAIDKDKKLISGEFNFVAIDQDKNKKYTVTDGKFKDIPYKLE